MKTEFDNTKKEALNKTDVSSSLFSKLELSIFHELPHLRNIEVGQRFHSDYYGTVTATKITNFGKMVYSIYGFDEKDGSPRDCYYPRDLGLLGKNIMLNDVLKWHSLNGRDKYSHFEVSKGEAYFSIYDGEETESIVWDLSKSNLKDQSKDLIDFLSELL